MVKLNKTFGSLAKIIQTVMPPARKIILIREKTGKYNTSWIVGINKVYDSHGQGYSKRKRAHEIATNAFKLPYTVEVMTRADFKKQYPDVKRPKRRAAR